MRNTRRKRQREKIRRDLEETFAKVPRDWAKEVIPSGVSPLIPEPVPEKRSLRNYLLCIGFMGLVLYLTFHFLLKDTDGLEIYHCFRRANWRYLFLAFVPMFLSQAAFALMLKALMRSLLHLKAPWRFCRNAAYIGFYFNNITPSASGGQPMQVYYLYRCGLKIAEGSVLLVLTSLFYNGTMIVMGTVAWFWRADLFEYSLGKLRVVLMYSYLVNGGLMLLYLFVITRPALLKRWAEALVRFLSRLKWVKESGKLSVVMEHFFESYSNVSSYLKGKTILILCMVGLGLLQNTCLFSVPYFVARALGAPHQILGPSFATQAVLTLTSSGFPTPGAVGITETAFIQLFGSFMPRQTVMSAMILTRTISLYAFLIPSMILVFYAFVRAGKGCYRLPCAQEARPAVVPIEFGMQDAPSMMGEAQKMAVRSERSDMPEMATKSGMTDGPEVIGRSGSPEMPKQPDVSGRSCSEMSDKGGKVDGVTEVQIDSVSKCSSEESML